MTVGTVYWSARAAGIGKTLALLEQLLIGEGEALILTFSRTAASELERRWLALRERRVQSGEPLPTIPVGPVDQEKGVNICVYRPQDDQVRLPEQGKSPSAKRA